MGVLPEDYCDKTIAEFKRKEGNYQDLYWALFFTWAKECGFIQPQLLTPDVDNAVFNAFGNKMSDEVYELIELEYQMIGEGHCDSMETRY